MRLVKNVWDSANWPQSLGCPDLVVGETLAMMENHPRKMCRGTGGGYQMNKIISTYTVGDDGVDWWKCGSCIRRTVEPRIDVLYLPDLAEDRDKDLKSSRLNKAESAARSIMH